MSAGSSEARFAFTKLVVHDLGREAAFYRAVCGYGEPEFLKGDIAGRPIEELILRRPEGALDLVLLTYPEGPPPSPSGVITAFNTPDLDAFQASLLDAGGTVVRAIKWIEVGTNRLRIGFFADPEGHLLEVMER
jgi:predicted enzyme related to lactoylglutathione lyase